MAPQRSSEGRLRNRAAVDRFRQVTTWAARGGSVPIYEYQCPDCGYQFEQLQKISDEPIRVCPNCEQTHVGKLVSQTSCVLKGGGWYKDHYGLKGKSEGAKETPSSGSEKTGDKPAATAP